MEANVFDDHCCSLGEGPLWHSDRQSLFWFDIDNRLLFEKSPSHQRRKFEFDRTVSAAGIIDASRLLIASERDLFVFDLENQNQQVLCELESDNDKTRSNDGRADPYGGFWIGTMGYHAEPNAGSIYRFYKGELRKLYSQITISNSICFSPDRSKAYFTDSANKVIRQVGLDNSGWPAGEAVDLVDLSGEKFSPDGCVCDTQGRLWSAQWMASRVAVYSPEGTFIESHSIPTSQATCPAFGGPNHTTLFVTTAGAHLPNELKGTQPAAGFVFKIEDLGPGQNEHRIILQ